MLPIEEVLPELKAALAVRNCAVLVAPPGAGKTTVAPLALMDEPWATDGRLIVLEPRRLAARAAAARMAQTLGESIGQTVGFRVRGESRVSAQTRIEVVTEGVFTRMILADPALEGVSGVLFDEFHERSLDADLGLAFARNAQTVLREDLRLLVMSATLDGARISSLLGGATVIRSEGRTHPVETRYLGRDEAERPEAQVARAIRRALDSEPGSVLAFLPGAGEIRRTEQLLREALERRPDTLIAPLYGALDVADQECAIAPAPAGMRKVVLATSIAETSLTIEGVRVVIDSGFARAPRYDPRTGLTRLVTVRVSRAAADQRRGRAGRTTPGICYRLWDEPETRALAPFDRPEILESDLAGLALDLARWGAASADGLALLDRPPAAALKEARATLSRLGALDPAGALTPNGRGMASLPLPPRLAHMVLRGANAGCAGLAARIAAVLTERGLGGTGTGLGERLERFESDRGRRAEQARAFASRWSALAVRTVQAGAPSLTEAELLASAYPERVARARGALGEYQLVSGRGARLDAADPLARSDWLAVGELASGGAQDRILMAAPLDEPQLLAMFADQIVVETRVEVDPQGRARGRVVRRLGVVEISSETVRPNAAEQRAALVGHLQTSGFQILPAWKSTAALRARVGFLGGASPETWPELTDAVLLASLDDWLGPMLERTGLLAEITPQTIEDALWILIGPERRRDLDRLAPERFTTAAATTHAIDYAAEGGPRVEVRVQELFGLAVHPTVAEGRIPLTLALLSPAHRPVQLTRDLPSFWAGSWKAVRAEMRGRYPKHPWPENPLKAAPTTRAKPRAR